MPSDVRERINKLLIDEYDKRGRFFKDEVSNITNAIVEVICEEVQGMNKCYFKRDFNRLMDYLDAKKREEGYNQALTDLRAILEQESIK